MGALASSIGYSACSLLLSFVNAQLVPVRVNDDGSPASGSVERFKREPHVMLLEVLYCFLEIIHFKNNMRTIARWLHERTISNGKCVRADFILNPKSIAFCGRISAGKSQNVFIKGAGTRDIRGGIYYE
jgi:hypothetical protein